MKLVNKNYRSVHVVISLAILSQIILILSIMPQINSEKLSEKSLETVLNIDSIADTNYHIPIGKQPLYIQLVYKELDKESLYVSNFDSDTVSIFDVDNESKIAQDISIDEPRDMEVDKNSDMVYIISSASNNISRLDGNSNIKLNGDIELKGEPISLAINDKSASNITLYIAISNGENRNGYIAVVDGNEWKFKTNIDVNVDPRAIEINPNKEKVYVANNRSNTLSVIDISGKDIANWNVEKNISVGINPGDVEIYNDNFTLVANTGSNSVSVINTTDKNVDEWKGIKNITVGEGPRAIAIYDDYEKMYVANSKSDTISVINTSDTDISKWKVEEPITVGKGPVDFAIDTKKEKVYVANSVSNTLSVIDPSSNSLRGGFSFEVIPFGSGQINCNGFPVPTSVYFYINSTTSCKAIPNKGYSFLALSKVLDDNSTQLINKAPSFFTIYDYVGNAIIYLQNFFGFGPSEVGADLNIKQFGNYVASFRESPPPLPPEFWGAIFSFVLSTILAVWLIPPLTRKFKSIGAGRKYNQYSERITSFVELEELNRSDIVDLKTKIKNDYLKDNINQKQYENLKDEIFDLEYNLLKKNISKNGDNK